jgi:hypothetical protein
MSPAPKRRSDPSPNPPAASSTINTIRLGLSESLESFCLRKRVKCDCDFGPPLESPRRHFWNHKTGCRWIDALYAWRQWGRDRLALRYEGDNKS